MFTRIYIEEEALNHPRTKLLLKKYHKLPQIICHHYGEIFNLKNQDFRTQKQSPSLIIAIKKGKKILPTPPSFGIGGAENYYFSHIQNCLYDCRYCFLQGAYNSANYLWFVNYEDFQTEITKVAENNQNIKYFFSGYDGDSLIFESFTNFAKEFIGFFAKIDNTFLELRTKSVNINLLKSLSVIDNIIVAFSFTPEEISKAIEHKTPPVRSRIKAMQELSQLGWKVGIRMDPLIYDAKYKILYAQLIEQLFTQLNLTNLHSITIGELRFPQNMYKKIINLYPEEPLLYKNMVERGNIISYPQTIETELREYVMSKLSKYITSDKIFSCINEIAKK
jgi:spore photoproduct lyase